MDRSVVDAVRDEIRDLPKELQESGLAAAAITLAQRLEAAAPRDTAGIARELRATLTELYLRANQAPEEDDPIADILRQSRAALSKRT